MFRKILPLLILFFAILACTTPIGVPTPTSVPDSSSLTPVSQPSGTDLPILTPPATPIPAARVESGDQAFFDGDWEAALLEYQTAFAGDSDPQIKAAALLGIGRTHYQLGALPASLDTLRQLLNDYPDPVYLPRAHFALAQAYEALGRYADAAQAYSEYLTLRPGVIDSYIHEWRADDLSSAGDYLGAIDAYQSAITSPRLGDSIPIEIKIANVYAALGDHTTALVAYTDIYTRTTNDYTKAQIDYLIGQSYTALEQYDQAYTAYLDAVENYPLSYDTYQALIILVDAGYPVSEFDRGLIDYFAGQYSLAITAFDRHLASSIDDAGTAYYYKGLAYRALNDAEMAIANWNIVIQSYPEDSNWADAWEEKGYTQWAWLDLYDQARQTFLDFVDQTPWHPRAPEFLSDAARVAERAGDLGLAAEIWERIPPEYPASNLVMRSIFLSGIAHYRLGEYDIARTSFEYFLSQSVSSADKAAGHFWIAKCFQALGNETAAVPTWERAANADPTGYYSERARDILSGRPLFDPPVMYDLGTASQAEQAEAETWMGTVFAIPAEVDLSEPGLLLADARLIRGTELWNLGLYEQARSEFEDLRADTLDSPVDSYRLTNYLLDLGLYRSAIFAARQVLSLNQMDDAATMNAPIYFNHIRFGSYYRELILPIAEAYNFHPLFLFSVVRQESLFEGFVHSSAGARGLMQIIPATGQSIATNTGWPPGYTADDLYRPKVSLMIGTDYLADQRDYFDGELFVALAAYNAGPGNAAVWWDLAKGDPDLFVEIIRFDETRDYIRGIYEVFSIYRRLYDRSP
jgi:soluble lytic murein transglycosylase